jgi:hypothetical protein
MNKNTSNFFSLLDNTTCTDSDKVYHGIFLDDRTECGDESTQRACFSFLW